MTTYLAAGLFAIVGVVEIVEHPGNLLARRLGGLIVVCAALLALAQVVGR